MRIPFLRTFMCVTVSLLPAQAMASSSELRALENELRVLVSGRSGEYGVAALDLRDGASVAVNGDMPFAIASTVKLAIAAAFLKDADAGRRSLDDVVGGRRASDAMELMIVRSDNHAADQLLAAVGGPAV